MINTLQARRQILGSAIVLIASSASFASVGATAAIPPDGCRAAPAGTAAEWVERARRAVGAPRDSSGAGIRFTATQVTSWNYQSDRQYRPYLAGFDRVEVRYAPAIRAEVVDGPQYEDVVSGPTRRIIAAPERTYLVNADSGGALAPPGPGQHAIAQHARELNPWAVLDDWQHSADAHLVGRCFYRDAWRVVLARRGPQGEERLFLADDNAFPVKRESIEPHYLWGQVHVEDVYTTWLGIEGGGYYPLASFRLLDGEETVARTLGLRPDGSPAAARITADDHGALVALPDSGVPMPYVLPAFLQPRPPDTLRVAPNLYLLTNIGYREAVTRVGDTVVVLEATQGEERARQDSVWIGALFPGRHPVMVIVTDVAWPHIAGVRFWAASGATIVTHANSVGFLRRVLARRWTLAPDRYERRRTEQTPRIRAIVTATRLGDGLDIIPIDGVASEGALMVYARPQRFLWASDYVQDASQPTLYASEVRRAACRAGIVPSLVAAQHLPLTRWGVVDSLQAADGPCLRPGASPQ